MTSHMFSRGTVPAMVMAAFCILTAGPREARATVSLFGPGGQEFDVVETTAGYISDGTNDSYDSAYYLYVNGTQYTADGTAATEILGGRGYRMAEFTTGNLTVQRSFWVPATGAHDYLRYFDTIRNNASGTETVTVRYTGNLGSDSSTGVTATSSGDLIVGTDDFWYCTDDGVGSDPSLGHVWWGDSGLVEPETETLSSDSMETIFTVEIPAGETVAFVIFAIQADDAAHSLAAAEFLAEFPLDAQEGLDSTALMQIVNWALSGAPLIRFTEDDYTVEEGGERTLAVEVEDMEGDPVTVTWDLDNDGAYDDGEGLTAVFSAVGFDGPATREIGVRAFDGENERMRREELVVENVPPVFVSDPGEGDDLLLHRGEEWIYQIDVDDQANRDMPEGSELDILTVSVTDKPPGMIYSADMSLTWSVPRTDEVVGEHPVQIQCSDGDGGLTQQDFVLHVLENTPPSRPVIISPKEVTVNMARPTLRVQNAEDLDGDELTYTFQIATVGTFSSDSIVDYAVVNENPTGETAWTVNRDLEHGVRYFWRVWAQDDKEDGPAASTFFNVDLSHVPADGADAEDAPTDTIGDFYIEDKAEACSCTVAGRAEHGGAGMLFLLAGLALALARTRRRMGV
jgi:hypothetical protein